MWMRELATNTITADSRMGSHSAASPTMTTSCRGPVPQSCGPIGAGARAPQRARARRSTLRSDDHESPVRYRPPPPAHRAARGRTAAPGRALARGRAGPRGAPAGGGSRAPSRGGDAPGLPGPASGGVRRARPVLTAHPTESARRTILDLQARVAEGLLARDGAPEAERRAIEAQLEGEVELLWLTEEVRRDRLSVMDEVSNALWYLEDRLLEAAARVRERLVQAFEDEDATAPPPAILLTLGSWVGGDRDGNPFVTADATLAAARRARRAVLSHYASALTDLGARLSVSGRLAAPSPELRASLARDRAELPGVLEQHRGRDVDEPLRLKLSFMHARIAADPPGYASPREFERDLVLLGDALDAAGAAHARRALVDPLVARVRAHGFHGYRLDVREDAGVHTRALAALAMAAGLNLADGAAIRGELASPPRRAPRVALTESTERVIEVFRVMRAIQDEIGAAAAATYIVSRTRSADDLLRVLLLAREAGLR